MTRGTVSRLKVTVVEERQRKSAFSNFKRFATYLMLVGICGCFLTGCVANIVAHYRSFGDPSTAVPVFEPDLNNPEHAPLSASTVRDLAELSDSAFGAVTTTGSLKFNTQWEVIESAVFPQSYLDVAIIQTNERVWVYAESHPIEDKSENWYTRDYHIYEFGTTTPTFTYSCSSSNGLPYKGRPTVDLAGEGTFSIVIPCKRVDRTNFLAFLNLNNGTVRTIEVPFNPVIFAVGNSRSGRQSVIVLADYPRIKAYDLDNPSPADRELDLRKYNRATYTVQETLTGELKGELTDNIPEFDSLMHNEIPTLRHRVVLDHGGEFLFNDELWPGHALMQRRFDGSLKNWWYFDVRANFRLSKHWVYARDKYNDDGFAATFGVLYGWGHWCQWNPCQDAIIQFGPNGRYKLIDITTEKIGDLILTSQRTLLATREGKIYKYSLDEVKENIAWQTSDIPDDHLDWISRKSGVSMNELSEIYGNVE